MITDTLLNIFQFFANALISLLPEDSFNPDIVTSVQSFFEGAFAYNSIFPVDTLFVVLQITLWYMTLVFLWRGINYFISLVRGN